MIQTWYFVSFRAPNLVAIEGVSGAVKPNRSLLTADGKAESTRPNRAVLGKPAAILVPCSGLKSAAPCCDAQAISLPRDSQEQVETAWLRTLADLSPNCRASDLYQGRGFRLALNLAAECEAELYIVSAGLGLVRAGLTIPAYGLTLSGTGPDSIAARVKGRFDPSAWWEAVGRGPFGIPLDAVFEPVPEGVVIAALSHSYAQLVGPALAELPQNDLVRLRIVGSGLRSVLPEALRPYIMPYDARVTEYAPGARVDLAQRALTHFVRECLPELPHAGAAAHARWVATALGKTTAPAIPVRRRCADDAILEVIDQYLGSEMGVARLLRVLRDQKGVACGEVRFARLYGLATSRRAA
jgi:hypothetical protein